MGTLFFGKDIYLVDDSGDEQQNYFFIKKYFIFETRISVTKSLPSHTPC